AVIAAVAVPPLAKNGLLLAIALGYCAYSVYVGGDAWEHYGTNRFISVVYPLFFVLLNPALNMTAGWLRNLGRGVRTGLAASAVALVFLCANGLFPSPTIDRLEAVSIAPQPLHVYEHSLHVGGALWWNARTQPDAIIALGWAGIVPFFANFRVADYLGYN